MIELPDIPPLIEKELERIHCSLITSENNEDADGVVWAMNKIDTIYSALFLPVETSIQGSGILKKDIKRAIND